MLHIKKSAFTMIELIFVIVVLGILAAVAIPKFTATRTDAQISKGRADISSIRSSIISERQTRLIKGDSSWINSLSHETATLFDGNGTVELLMYGIKSASTNGHWRTIDSGFPYVHYIYRIGNEDCEMDYNSSNGKFTLKDGSADICDKLVN